MCVLQQSQHEQQHVSVRMCPPGTLQQQARRINSILLHVVSSPLQAIKTCLNYLSETNGELHYFLHNYVSDRLAADLPLTVSTSTQPQSHAAARTPLVAAAAAFS